MNENSKESFQEGIFFVKCIFKKALPTIPLFCQSHCNLDRIDA